jgi:hypothetical protein
MLLEVNLNEKLLVRKNGGGFRTNVFSKIKHNLIVGQKIVVRDEDLKKDTKAEITYVGQRFCTVLTERGYSISINYPSMVDQNNKDIPTAEIKVFEEKK